jgi:hypothetical protein
MVDLKIVCKNKSGAPRAYFLFVEKPDVSGSNLVFETVYISSTLVPSGTGTAVFDLRKGYFAITGASPGEALGNNVTVDTYDYGIVKLCQGSKLGSSFAMSGGSNGMSASFDWDLLKQDCNKNGSFSISCSTGTFKTGGRCGT